MPSENPRDRLLTPSQLSGPIYKTITTTQFSTDTSTLLSSSGGASQPLSSAAVTSDDKTGEVNENASHYATLDAKPQPVSVPPTDDGRVVYAEVNKTQGGKVRLSKYQLTDILICRHYRSSCMLW